MRLFEKKPEAERIEFRRALHKRVPGAPRVKFPFRERIQLERKIFGPKSIERISKDVYKSAILKMDKAKYRARTDEERINIEKKVRFFKKLGGIKKLRK
jgi:hypothetical protein